jgi:hypothetical protein
MSLAQLSDDSPVDPDDELLVAYLDGELDLKTRTEVEDRLLDDESLRIRLQQLQSSWEWLDDLPSPVPSEKLVETTLEFVVSDLNILNKRQESFWSRYRWGLSIASLCLVAAIGAATVVTLQRQAAYKQELADLAIAEDLKAYVHGSDLKLMRQLSANSSWNQAIDAAAMVGDLYFNQTSLVGSVPLKDRAAALPTFSLDDRAKLAASWDQFQALSEVEREKVRRTAAAVAAQPDAESLLATMRTFAEWQESLAPASLRDDLASQNQEVRTEALRKAVDMTLKEATRRSGALLDEETVERIAFALQQILKQRFDVYLQSHPEHKSMVAEWAERLVDNPGMLRFWMRLDGFSRDGRWNSRDSEGRSDSDMRRPLSLQELADIEFILTNNAVRDLEYLSGGDFDLKVATLNAWAEEAIRRKALSSRGEKPDLLQEYLNLEPEIRDQLDLLPPSEILDRLLPQERRPGPPGPPPR